MGKIKKYWHISPVENKENILSEGIKCSEDGYVYMITSLEEGIDLFDVKVSMPDMIAFNQVFLNKYDLYEIDAEGLERKTQPDNVAEILPDLQKRVKQNVIQPKYVKHLGTFETNTKEVIIFIEYFQFLVFNSHLIINSKHDPIISEIRLVIDEQIKLKFDRMKEYQDNKSKNVKKIL